MVDYSEDVAASEDRLGRDNHRSSDDNDSGFSDDHDSDLDNARPSAAAAAAGTAANGLPAAIDEDAAASAQNALLSGELSTNAALLQLQVSCCGAVASHHFCLKHVNLLSSLRHHINKRTPDHTL